MKRALHDALRCVPHFAKVSAGYLAYLRRKSTPRYAYRSMRKLTYLTNGRFNAAVAKFYGWLRPAKDDWGRSGVLGDLSHPRLKSIVDELDENGYFVFDQRLPDQLVDDLVSFALSTPGHPIEKPEDATAGGESKRPEPRLFDRRNPAAVRQEFDTQTLFECPAIQQLASDPSLFTVAQAYLRFSPVLDAGVMWWSAAGFDEDEDRSRAAQMYHIDMDRIKFLNFNIYLTDVTPETGPHCFVRGSHRRKPRQLLKGGRISDVEIREHYDEEDIRELTGVKGTISAVDTSGFHKGKPLSSGDRLFCQIRFANSLFGQNYPMVEINERFRSDFIDHVRRSPSTFPGFRNGRSSAALGA